MIHPSLLHSQSSSHSRWKILSLKPSRKVHCSFPGHLRGPVVRGFWHSCCFSLSGESCGAMEVVQLLHHQHPPATAGPDLHLPHSVFLSLASSGHTSPSGSEGGERAGVSGPAACPEGPWLCGCSDVSFLSSRVSSASSLSLSSQKRSPALCWALWPPLEPL